MSESGEWSNQPLVTPLVIVAGSGQSGVFVFDPKAVAGDLIASLTDALTDPFGDVTVKGVASYVTAGGRRYAVGLNTSGPGGLPGLTVQNTASFPTIPAGVYAESSASGTLAEAALYSGQATAGDTAAQVVVFGALESGITNGEAEISAGQIIIGTAHNTVVVNDNTGTLDLQNNLGSAPAATGAGSALYSNTNGTLSAIDQTGWAGQPPVIQADATTGTNANLVGATVLSAIFTIPANNLKVGTVFTIEMPYQATMEATNTLQLGLSIDGSTSFTTSDTISAAIVGAGIGVRGVMRVILQCTSTGVSGKINTFTDGTTGQAGATATFANRGALTGQALNVTFDTTASHTIRINSLWGGSTAGQTVSGFGSRCIREGP